MVDHAPINGVSRPRLTWSDVGVAVSLAMAALALAVAWGGTQADLRHLETARTVTDARVDALGASIGEIKERLARIETDLRAVKDWIVVQRRSDIIPGPQREGGR